MLLRRLGFYLGAAWAAITLNFVIPRLMPGNPADVIINQLQQKQRVTPTQITQVHRLFGGDSRPLWQEYFRYWGQLAHGNLGISVTFYPSPVLNVIKTGFLWTVLLVGICTVLAFVIGTALGIVTGWRPGRRLDSILTPTSLFVHAVPYFWFALILALVFGFKLGWLPLGGGMDPNVSVGFTWAFISSAITHAILPAVTIVGTSINGWLIGMRNMMITTVNEDYVLLAKGKGLKERRVIFSYAARNAILPNISSFAISIGMVVGGSLLTEMVFNYPGLGNLFSQAVANLDYPLMQALFLLISLTVLAANFIADSVYVLIDPRTREGE